MDDTNNKPITKLNDEKNNINMGRVGDKNTELKNDDWKIDDGVHEESVIHKGKWKKRKHFSDTRINAYATAVMAFLTLCTLGVSFLQLHRNQQHRLNELELTRIQNELSEVKKVSFELIDNGIYEFVCDLCNNLTYNNNYEELRRKLDNLSTGLETKCNLYTMTIIPYGISAQSNDVNMYEISNNLMETYSRLQSLLNFFVDISKIEDKAIQKDCLMTYVQIVKLSPVTIIYDKNGDGKDEEFEVTFDDYCKACNYDFLKIKMYISLYLNSTVENVFTNKVNLYNYVSQTWANEVIKLNEVYEKIGMEPIEMDTEF